MEDASTYDTIYTMTPEYYRFEGLDMVGYPPQKKLWKIHENQSRSFSERERTMDFHSLLEGVISDPGIDILHQLKKQGKVGLFFSHFFKSHSPTLDPSPKSRITYLILFIDDFPIHTSI